jgi:acyl carrier protein phosphodiesterase
MDEICAMNYLAHLVLGGSDSDVRLGNFIGDSVKGNQLNDYPDSVAAGIRFHRWVDHFADGHPTASHARAALRHRLGRLAPVGVDLLYDHFLAKHFSFCCPDLGELESYAKLVLEDLATRKVEMPLRSQRFFEGMRQHNWLMGYATELEMQEVCLAMDQRIAKRLGVPSNLGELFIAAEEFGWSELEDEFFLFWQEFRHKAVLALDHPHSSLSLNASAAEK